MIMVLSPLDENLPKDAETCDFNDSLEDLIEPSEGEAHKSYEVLKGINLRFYFNLGYCIINSCRGRRCPKVLKTPQDYW
jgi:hypothetical protein